MKRSIATVSFLVRDYDEAISWFVRCLRFGVVESVDLGDGKRWVVVAPAGIEGARLLLAKATAPEQMAAIGRAAGGRVAFFLQTDDFDRDHADMIAAGVSFRETPRLEPYGKVAVFEDLYGNGWDLIQLRTGASQVRAG